MTATALAIASVTEAAASAILAITAEPNPALTVSAPGRHYGALFHITINYSLRSASTGSFLDAARAGIMPPISVKTTLSAMRINAGPG